MGLFVGRSGICWQSHTHHLAQSHTTMISVARGSKPKKS